MWISAVYFADTQYKVWILAVYHSEYCVDTGCLWPSSVVVTLHEPVWPSGKALGW